MNKRFLKERKTVAELEAEHAVQNERLGPEPVAFGFLHWLWLELLDQMEEGDELWTFSSSPGTWRSLCGRAGVALVRNGKIVDSLVTAMN